MIYKIIKHINYQKDFIINYIKEHSMSKDYVYAMWLEGTDGLNQVDEYFDLDI